MCNTSVDGAKKISDVFKRIAKNGYDYWEGEGETGKKGDDCCPIAIKRGYYQELLDILRDELLPIQCNAIVIKSLFYYVIGSKSYYQFIKTKKDDITIKAYNINDPALKQVTVSNIPTSINSIKIENGTRGGRELHIKFPNDVVLIIRIHNDSDKIKTTAKTGSEIKGFKMGITLSDPTNQIFTPILPTKITASNFQGE
jgi:hypothetical protein